MRHHRRTRRRLIPIPAQTATKRKRYRTPAESIAARSVRDGDCLRWTGFTRPDGYGMMAVGAGTPDYVHRVAYKLAKGEIPEGLQIDHTCGIRDCVNPGHLEAVTQRENLHRRRQPSRPRTPATHCRSGHALTEGNIYRWRNERRCRVCMRERARRRWNPAR